MKYGWPLFTSILCLLLIPALLLGGCGGVSTPAQTAVPATETAQPTEVPPPAETETPDPWAGLASPAELTADTVLFYRQDSLDARRGVLVPRAEAEAAADFPRTHRYDADFSAPWDGLLRLLDYCFSEGYAGFSLPAGELDASALTVHQRRELQLMYQIDDGRVLSLEEDGRATFWYEFHKDDAMEYFVQGLAAARRIIEELPLGTDDYENARVIWDYLEAHIEYGDRDTYYYNYGHQLYDALVGGVCVCSGYGDALYYLFNLCGLDCISVCGLGKDPDTPGGLDDHKWNIARLYGQDYCFDMTADDKPMLDGVVLIFGLSEETLIFLCGDRRTGIWTDDSVIPDCPVCFDPAAVWNDSPAGALRSWLWFYNETFCNPQLLLVRTGRFNSYTGDGETVGDWGVTGVPYEEFRAYFAEFMTEDCFDAQFAEVYRDEEGRLALHLTPIPAPVWRSVGVTEQPGGVYLAELTDAEGGTHSASFTVEETDGRYRIAGIKFHQ